jgi:hypothetical protein
MKGEGRGKKAVRLVVTGIGAAICVVSALISLAVLLAFFTERSDLVGSSLVSQRLTMIGVALFFVSIAILGLEAHRPRRIRRSHAACALVCAAGGAVLIWSALDDGHPGKEQPAPVAVNPPGPSSGWKPARAGGNAMSTGDARPKHAHATHAPAHTVKHAASTSGSAGEEPAAEASSVPYKDECGCEKVEEPYSPSPAEGSSEGEPSWSEPQEAPKEEGWEEPGWEEPGWEEPGWEEEGWEEEGWEEPAPVSQGVERARAAESEAWEREEGGWEEEEFEEEGW